MIETMTDPSTPLLEARAISKSFAQTRALVGANLILRPGVTHALLAAHGAGKSPLAPVLSVFENIFLPALGRPGRLSRPTMRRRASEILADLGQENAVSLDAEARDLSAAQRQLVEIAKALALKANLIFFDEPTASLSPTEIDRLLVVYS